MAHNKNSKSERVMVCVMPQVKEWRRMKRADYLDLVNLIRGYLGTLLLTLFCIAKFSKGQIP